ncbi:hypothetical protein LTR37_012081 [Vermiconidia calcicola]|uniref:Uncharacterized protein n=1 Tax=Vermiconidia calcicola TaxID=1690605 RepID=A0ACC3N0K2_9PEZI|nr:hypothetical protein LTR37_012081 [Vermiconidia calcicola]
MNTMLARNLGIRYFALLRRQPWPESSAIASRLESSQPIEEENSPYYHPGCFYPAQLGEVLGERYQIATKLGYGSGSTVWLARDLLQFCLPRPSGLALTDELNRWRWVRERYVAVKIGSTGEYAQRKGVEAELATLKRISHAQPQHQDLKPDNIMVRFEDPTLLKRDGQDEYYHPLPRKHKDGRIIYLSRNNYGVFTRPSGIVQITDFDLAVSGDTPRSGCISADIYRAPEAILETGYSYSADIWSLGVMLWDLLEGRRLFRTAIAASGEYDEQTHLAHITALLGPLPQELNGGRTAAMYFGSEGNLPTRAAFQNVDKFGQG